MYNKMQWFAIGMLLVALFCGCPDPNQPIDTTGTPVPTATPTPGIVWNIAPAGGTPEPAPAFLAASRSLNYGATVRALSLKALQQRLALGDTDILLTQLGGLREIYGFIIDDVNQDIILLGNINSALPEILTEDFAIALRNSWYYYLRLINDIYYYEYPGCSIDPDPGLNALLDDLMEQYSLGAITSEELKTQWEVVCSSTPQAVSIFGMPFNSNFADVLVYADYDLKNIVNGSDQLNIPDFKSLMDMKVDKAIEELYTSGTTTDSGFFNRFWFTLEDMAQNAKYKYVVDEGIVLLEECSPWLLTENMQQGGGETDPMTIEFTESFNAHFQEIAAIRPIFRKMESLFRLFALSQAMAELNVDTSWLSYLLDDMSIIGKTVPTSLSGCSAIREINLTIDPYTYYVIMPSCGGVEIPISVAENTLPAVDSSLAETRKRLYYGDLNNNYYNDTNLINDPAIIGTLSFWYDAAYPEKMEAFTDDVKSFIKPNCKKIMIDVSNANSPQAYSSVMNGIVNNINISYPEIEIFINTKSDASDDFPLIATREPVQSIEAYATTPDAGGGAHANMEFTYKNITEKTNLHFTAQPTILDAFRESMETILQKPGIITLQALINAAIDKINKDSNGICDIQFSLDLQGSRTNKQQWQTINTAN